MKKESIKAATEVTAQLKQAAEILEKVVANRAMLAQLSVEERTRLLKAAGEVYCPEVDERRRLVKAKVRQRKAEKIQRDQTKLNQTGIRKLRQEKVFMTPNVFPPKNFIQEEIKEDPDFREVVVPQNCYICKKDYSTIHHFYDQLCPQCAELNFFKRTESADLRGRVALLTGGRVKIAVTMARCGLDPEAARQWANAGLSKVQRLSRLEIREALPRNTLGKILKRELRRPYWTAPT